MAYYMNTVNSPAMINVMREELGCIRMKQESRYQCRNTHMRIIGLEGTPFIFIFRMIDDVSNLRLEDENITLPKF